MWREDAPMEARLGSDTTLEDFPPMHKEIVGLDALSAGKPLKEPEALALCQEAGVKVITCRCVTSKKDECAEVYARASSSKFLHEDHQRAARLRAHKELRHPHRALSPSESCWQQPLGFVENQWLYMP